MTNERIAAAKALFENALKSYDEYRQLLEAKGDATPDEACRLGDLWMNIEVYHEQYEKFKKLAGSVDL
jgi:hypothetical protein